MNFPYFVFDIQCEKTVLWQQGRQFDDDNDWKIRSVYVNIEQNRMWPLIDLKRASVNRFEKQRFS